MGLIPKLETVLNVSKKPTPVPTETKSSPRDANQLDILRYTDCPFCLAGFTPASQR